MINDYDLTRGMTIDGCPFLFLKGKHDSNQGVVLGHYTLRRAEDFLSFNAQSFMDVVIVLEYTGAAFPALLQQLTQTFGRTAINFHHGQILYHEKNAYYLLFEREDCNDVFALSTPYPERDSTVVFVYDGKSFLHHGEVVDAAQIQSLCKSGKTPVLAFERGLVHKLASRYTSLFERLVIHNENLRVEDKYYIVSTITGRPQNNSETLPEGSGYRVFADDGAYYGEGTFLEEKRADRQTSVEPIELKGIQLVSGQEFQEMDGEGLYSSVQRIGEFPADEVGETWFYVNKRADSFVEVYHADSDRVYVIKAMDPCFFSKVAIGMNKQEGIKLELLVRDLDVLATFLVKFGHKEMSFDMEALPDKSVEVRINVATGWVAQAKNAVRNLVKGEDGYGKTKYEKVQQLKRKHKPMRTIATITKEADGVPTIIMKTARGVQRIHLTDIESWRRKLEDAPPGTVHELVFSERYADVDAMARKLQACGWDYEYEVVDGKHIYNMFQPEVPVKTRDMSIPDLPAEESPGNRGAATYENSRAFTTDEEGA